MQHHGCSCAGHNQASKGKQSESSSYDEKTPLVDTTKKEHGLSGTKPFVMLLGILLASIGSSLYLYFYHTPMEKYGAMRGSHPLGELCGRPIHELPSIHMIKLKSRPDRLKFVQDNTAKPILQHLQFHEGFNPRSYSREGLRDKMKKEGWHPAPSFANLQNLKGEHGSAMRKEIIGRCLGFRDGEHAMNDLDKADMQDCKAVKGNSFDTAYFHNRNKTLGEIGLLGSHHMIWQQIAQQSNPSGWAIVLEDDRAVDDVAGLCSFIDKVEALPKVDGKPSWDYINVAPGEGRRFCPESVPEFERDGSFHRVRSSMCTSFYALTGNYAKYLEAAHPEKCLLGSDDFTTFACDPLSHPLHEAFAACFPQLKEQRMCLNWAGSPRSFYKEPHGSTANTSVSSDEIIGEDAPELAWLRKELGTDERIASPFANMAAHA